ncbi:inorganic pyrophosphatase-like [Argonauta hians]
MLNVYLAVISSRLCYLPASLRFSGHSVLTLSTPISLINPHRSICINQSKKWRSVKVVEGKSAGDSVSTPYNNNKTRFYGSSSSGKVDYCRNRSVSSSSSSNSSNICSWQNSRNLLLPPLLTAGNTTTTRSSSTRAIKRDHRPSISLLFSYRHLLWFAVQHRQFSLQSPAMSSYKLIEKGIPNTKDYKIYYSNSSGSIISPFHDIPLYSNTSKTEFNMVVEIPRWTNHKMEISKEDILNPIKQDVKNGKVRFVKNLFPHHGYIWNYGALPQTWEDPNFVTPDTNTKGDSDPIDVCEIGSKVHKRGAIIQVKILGVMCLIDEGETDWKVLAIDVTDPLASEINDVADIEKSMPGFVKATYEWFRYYKVPDGKEENQFAFNGEAKNKAYALKIITETHEQWEKLLNKITNAGGIHCENTAVANTSYTITKAEAKAVVDAAPELGTPAELPSNVNQWHYITK